jgi:hypothetical protein
MRFAGIVEYEGTEFAGWAGQPGLRTVEGTLTEALETVLRQPVKLIVAGRLVRSADEARPLFDLLQNHSCPSGGCGVSALRSRQREFRCPQRRQEP